MNSTSQNASGRNSVSSAAPEAVSNSVDATLRLIANLPAPEGLEDRVLAGLRSTPHSARILHWPAALRPSSGLAGSWMRSAAAAAIVFVVAGGGWGIYTRVQPSPQARVIVMPPRASAAGGFSSAGAMRTPQTLNGPVVAQSVAAQPAQVKPLKKLPARTVTIPLRHPHPSAINRTTAQPAASPVK
jgi:hypothetical protein